MKASVIDNTLFFGFDDGSSMTCECIKDQPAQKIANAITEMQTKLDATKKLAVDAIALIKF